MGRSAAGVKAVTLADESDEVVGMVCVSDLNRDILVVSEKGYGKRTSIDEYRITNRGAKGVKTINITEKTGLLVAIKDVTDDDDLIIINKKGVAIRFSVADLRVMGRNTQGVRLINLRNGETIASVCRVPRAENEDSEQIPDSTLSLNDISEQESETTSD
jgi:DNA gyrase subunit A